MKTCLRDVSCTHATSKESLNFDWSESVKILIDQGFDWSTEKSHCQINVVGRYVLTSKMNFSSFPAL